MKSIHVEDVNLAAAWERAVDKCWDEGEEFSTQYDRPEDPKSKDCTMLVHVHEPTADPRYHLGICMGLEDLEKYVQEVIYGVHDHWMNDTTNPNRWTYTYHQRLFGYPYKSLPITTFVPPTNQIAKVIEQLKECGHTRRAQAITWQPWSDADHVDPPCLQSLWFRVQDDKLNMNVRFRSNDLLKAAFPNMVALIELQNYVAQRVGVGVGSYIHLSDSMHIYGKDFGELEKFQQRCERPWEERVWTKEKCALSFAEGCRQLLEEEGMPDDKKMLIQARKAYWESL